MKPGTSGGWCWMLTIIWTNLKEEHYPLESITLACQRALRLDRKPNDLVPGANSTQVYRIVQELLK